MNVLLARILTVVLLVQLCACSTPPSDVSEPAQAVSQSVLPPAASSPASPLAEEEDTVLDVLMIGNSFCYHYTDELYGMAAAAGVELNLCNVYYSGCDLERHYRWHFVSKMSNYKFVSTTKAGRVETNNVDLQYCLDAGDWDVISLQDSGFHCLSGNATIAMAFCEPYAGELYAMLKEEFPGADLYWHQTWAYQVGFKSVKGSVPTAEKQTLYHEAILTVAKELCASYDVDRIPTGTAWQIARADPAVGDVLCDGGKSDFYHDGTTGGGQYLNACVWLEVLTGHSCIGNSWRPPNYELSEEKVAALQAAAHQAVAEVYGSDFAVD